MSFILFKNCYMNTWHCTGGVWICPSCPIHNLCNNLVHNNNNFQDIIVSLMVIVYSSYMCCGPVIYLWPAGIDSSPPQPSTGQSVYKMDGWMHFFNECVRMSAVHLKCCLFPDSRSREDAAGLSILPQDVSARSFFEGPRQVLPGEGGGPHGLSALWIHCHP